MKTTTTATAAYWLGSDGDSISVTLTIDEQGMIGSVRAAIGDADPIFMTAVEFDRIAAVMAAYRKEREGHPHYQTAPKCCPDHGHYDGWRCEACVSPEQRAIEDGRRESAKAMEAA